MRCGTELGRGRHEKEKKCVAMMCTSGSGNDDERVRGGEQCTINEYERERDEENCREKSERP